MRAQTLRHGGTAAYAGAAFLLIALCLCRPAEVRAQWTTPDAGGHIGNTNPGNVRIGGGTAAPTAVVHARGNLTSALTGTVAVTQNSATVTGTGTSFTTELAVGDSVKIGAEVFTVSAITSATSLTLDSSYLGATASGATAYRDPNLLAVDNGDGVNRLTVSRSGNVGVGTTSPQQKLAIEGSLAIRPSNAKYITPIAPLHVFGTSVTSRTDSTVQEVLTLSQSNTAQGGGGFQSKGSHFSVGLSFWEDPGNNYPRTRVDFRTTGRSNDWESTPNTVMSLRDDGNVGVGTTAPAERLHVSGGLVVTGATSQPLGVNGLFLGLSGGTTATIDAVQQGTDFRNLSMTSKTFSVKTWDGSALVQGLYQTNAGNVGVGMTTPGYKLDVAGSVNAAGLCLGGDCKSTWSQVGGQWSSGTGSISYSAGSVGIGTNSPAAARRLHVVGGSVESQFSTTAGQGYGFFIARDTNHFVENAYFDGTAWRAIQAGKAAIIQTYTSGGYALYLQADDTSRAADAARVFSPLFAVKLDGKVGVGTTSPTAKLHIISADDTVAPALSIRQDTNPAYGFDMTLDTNVNGNLSFNRVNNGASAAVLTFDRAGGNVGIGTGAPSSLLHLYSATRPALTISDSSAAAAKARVFRTAATQSDFAHNVAYDGTGWTLDDTAAGGSSISLGTNFVGINQWSAGAGYRTTSTSLYINSAGSIGVGTTAPGYKLDVAGSVNAAGLCLGGDCKSTWSQVGGQWSSGTSGAINYSGGRVGVGVGSPLGPLSVGDSSAAGSDGFLVIGKSNGVGGSRHFRLGFDAAFNFVIGDYGNNNAAGVWAAPFAINWQAPSGSIYINSAGNVGVGTASPAAAYKLDVAGAAQVGGNLNVTGNVTGATINATYQDVAEWVPSVQKLSPGTVVVLDAARTNHVLASTTAYDTKVAGVVSESPGLILGAGGAGQLKVATTGRVKVKVDATRGAIMVGDLLVTSGVEGVAMKSVPVDLGGTPIHRPGTIIGKALEPLKGGVGEILVLLSLQ